MNPISINLPPIILTYDPVRKWCWTAPNGKTGTHERSAVQAVSVATAGMGCLRIDDADLASAAQADAALAAELAAANNPQPETNPAPKKDNQ